MAFGIAGKNLIKSKYIIHDFGVKVGMNICAEKSLRRIQTTQHEIVTQQIEKQASSKINLTHFNLDYESEILRRLSGSVKSVGDEYKYIENFSGSEGISLTTPKESFFDIEKIVSICQELNEAYFSNDYKKTDFAFYDNFCEEKDSDKIGELNKALLKKLQEGNEELHLAAPQFIDFDKINFCYTEHSKKENIFDDLTFEDLFNSPQKSFNNYADFTLEKIEKQRVYTYDINNECLVGSWPLFKCIVAEIEHKGEAYVISNGIWRKVSQIIKDKINKFCKEYNSNSTFDYLESDIDIFDSKWSKNKGANREEKYNQEIVNKNKNTLISFDKAKITIGDEKRFEMCDIMSENKDLIHVKVYKSTSSLSHLFTQIRFYSEAFSIEEKTRAEMRNYISQDKSITPIMKTTLIANIPEKNSEVIEHEHTVIFCILCIDQDKNISDLPLMAKYELMQTYKYITENRKFKAEIVFRKVTSTKPKK